MRRILGGICWIMISGCEPARGVSMEGEWCFEGAEGAEGVREVEGGRWNGEMEDARAE